MLTDSEVEEMPLYRGANLFQLTRTGSLVDSSSTLTFSREPTGIGFDPSTQALFISDDDKYEIFIVRPGLDGRYGTADDPLTSFSTEDCEGIGYDPKRKTLLVVDSRESKIFELTRAGELVRIISLSTARDANRALAAVTVAPTSNPNDSPSATSYWVTDRRVDNNADPNENDGRIYEVLLP